MSPFSPPAKWAKAQGLGLSVVHGIMQTHLGAVDVQSTLGQGSVFTLYFPTTGDAVAPIVAAPHTVIIRHGNGRTVMYVDDDQALVFLVKRVLTRKGYAVLTYTDPQAAQAALRANPKAVDLLVTDYNMPGYSGLDLLREAKAIRPDLPVALASGYVTPELESRAMAEGANALIYKPNDVNELCETVERLIDAAAAWPLTTTLEVLHVDAHWIIVNKPSGLLAVPGKGPDKQDCLSIRVQQIYPDALIVHRLDMATSGLMVMARGPMRSASSARRLRIAWCTSATRRSSVASCPLRTPIGKRLTCPSAWTGPIARCVSSIRRRVNPV